MKYFIFFSLLTCSSISFAQSTEQIIGDLELKRKNLESMIDRTPYKEEQHLAIEAYFRGLTQFALDVKDYSNSSKRFNNAVSRMGVDTFCSKVFLDKKRWDDLVTNCTKNNFFLCAEEVRALPEIKASLKNSLWEALKKAFDSASTCKSE
jgi:hypothetical protein